MVSYVVYIDHEHAKVFKMKTGGAEGLDLHHHAHLHHNNREENKKKDSSSLYHEVAEKLSGAGEILVLGHGTAKDQFVHHLKDHKHADLAKKVVGVEAVDKPTDNQILALARKFFKSHHLFS
jgi:stalled ribosome rescue protein Dom34